MKLPAFLDFTQCGMLALAAHYLSLCGHRWCVKPEDGARVTTQVVVLCAFIVKPLKLLFYWTCLSYLPWLLVESPFTFKFQGATRF